jgi:hypothetical protein
MKLLDTVILRVDVPESDLRAGDVGTIVDVQAPGVFMVEFVRPDGRTHGLIAIEQRALRSAARTDVLTVRRSA